MKIQLIVIAVIFIVIAFVNFRHKIRRMKHGEILLGKDMQKKYGLYAENRPDIKIDPLKVPENLRDLISMAEKWGVGDDIIRSDIEDKASDMEKITFQKSLKDRTKHINSWLDSYDKNHAMPKEATHFMYMLEALAEMGLWPDKPE